ncbi:MAG: restriction endonuclease subunit S [Planctomycetes bacterium]|nr:restriction endonuclease subunit S [Planctomycetota bacterium]
MARSSLYPPSVDPGFPFLQETPEGWIQTTFGEALEVVERPVALAKNNTYRLVNAKRNRGGITLRGTLQGREILTKTQFEVKAGDFLISRRQIIHGACGVVPRELDGAIVSNEYSTLKPRAGLLLDFLRHYSNTPYFQRTCFHSSHGVDVEKMIFKIGEWLVRRVDRPPIGEQRKIAAILSAVDDATEATQAIIDQLRFVKKAMMAELLTRGLPGRHTQFKQTEAGEIPHDWRVRPLKEVARCFNGKAAGTGGSWLRVFKTKHVYDGMVRLDKIEYARDDSAAKTRVDMYLRDADVLTPNMAHGTIGRIAFVPMAEDKWTVDGQVMVLRADRINLLGRFLFESLSLPRGRQRLLDLEKGGAFDTLRGQTHIYPRDVAEIPLALPPLEEQRSIAAASESFDAPLETNQQHMAGLRELKQGLMNRLLTGELRVPPDEAAT